MCSVFYFYSTTSRQQLTRNFLWQKTIKYSYSKAPAAHASSHTKQELHKETNQRKNREKKENKKYLFLNQLLLKDDDDVKKSQPKIPEWCPNQVNRKLFLRHRGSRKKGGGYFFFLLKKLPLKTPLNVYGTKFRDLA